MSFKVKALYSYSSEHDDDLKFDEGQVITITDEEDADWYTGEYTDDATGEQRSGLFPRNFVERYEPVTPPRPVKRPQAAAPVPVPAPPVESEEELEEEPEPEERPGHATSEDEVEEEARKSEGEDDADPIDNNPAPPPPPVMATKPVPAPPQEPRSPPMQASKPVPPPPAQEAVRSPPLKPLKPSEASSDDKPVASSFKDRIAAFNRGGAAPVAPPKPGGFGGVSGSSGFVKKSYVAPPPSRNAYVPPPTQAPVAKIYRREEESETRPEDGSAAPPPATSARPEEAEDDQPKPMSLKERMAMLQKQQLEQQAKHADAAAKKAKPKPPPKKSSGTSQPPPVPEAVTDEVAPMQPASRVLSNDSLRPEPVLSPERDVLADPLSVEDEEPMAASIHSIDSLKQNVPAAGISRAATEEEEVREPEKRDNAEEEEVEEEDIDPEIRRRMELRERMAKMSGGMGMGVMFGAPAGFPGMGARKPPKPKTTDDSIAGEEQAEIGSPPAQPVAIMPGMAMPGMALPGMGMPRPKKTEPPTDELEVSREDEDEDDGEPISKSIAPEEVPDVEDLKEQHEEDEESEIQPERSLPPPPQPPPESRPAPPLPPSSTDEPKRRSIMPPPETALTATPSLPQRAQESSEPRAAPIPPATQIGSPPLPPNSPPRQSLDQKRNSRLPPPVPGPVETAAYARAPPPPPPAAPPRPSAEERRSLDRAREEKDEDEGAESDTEEVEAEDHDDDELHHAGLPSLGPSTRAPPPPPPPGQPPAQVPRSGPPPLPSQPPRQSRDFSRAPPPVPPPVVSPIDDDDEYDPYNYQSNPQGVPTGSATSTPRVEIQQPDLYGASPPTSPVTRAPMSPPIPQGPPPPPVAPSIPPAELPHQQPPPPPPVAPPTVTSPQAVPAFAAPQAPPRQAPPPVASPPPPTIQQPSRQSLDLLNRSQTRRSVDVPRPSGESHEYIAEDVDLSRESNWWAHRRSPPPVFQNRDDVSIEYDESTTVQNDGRALTAKHVYVLFMDYSQTIVTAYFSQDNPTGGAELQQRHEPPPARLRQDQLEAAHARFGARLATAAKGKENHAVGDGTALGFVQELVRSAAPGALAPVGTRAFGALVYSNMANATLAQHDEIRAGDVVSFRNARLQGHRGGLKQKYSLDLPAHAAVVLDWDGSKHKLRVLEQQNGRKVKVESYKLADLKTGEAKIWRVMSREWVGWGSTS